MNPPNPKSFKRYAGQPKSQPTFGSSRALFGAVTFIAAVVALSGSVHGEGLKFASYFGDHMVLQRGRTIHVWGEGAPTAEVQVSIGSGRAAATIAADGSWQVDLNAIAVGGPYALTAKSGDTSATVADVFCGDVWLCAGQSNMQLPVKACEPDEQRATLKDQPQVRLCSVAKTPSSKPLTSAKIKWQTCTTASAQDFSAVAYFFVCELTKDPGLATVPVGVIDSSFGGTTCEGWIPQPALASFSPEDLHDSLFGIKPANLFNAMIAPLGHAGVKGVVWYQGESNAAHPGTYPRLLATMIGEWRKQFEEPDLPLLVIQLPDYAKLWEGYYWPWEREAQARAAAAIPHTALVVALNTTDGYDLHPKQKLEIGRRAALMARREVYHENVIAQGPIFRQAQVEGLAIRITFDTGQDSLANCGPDGVRGFAVAGADGNYRFAKAKIEGKSVAVQCDEVPEPKTVRYAWAGMPQGSLHNQSGLPAAPFRTDDLPCENVEVQPQRVTRRVATPVYEVVIAANGMVSSLVVRGAQFLSNEPGAAGGTTIPGLWEPRTLTQIKEIGPKILSCSDTEATLQMAFEERSMRWTLANRSKGQIALHFALSPLVRISKPVADGKAELSRQNASLIIGGIDILTNTPTGAVLIRTVKAGGAATFSIEAH